MPEPAELCAYCVTAVLTGNEKLEHPIPAALGSSLTVQTVCDACNEWAGREIDQPFLADDLLREYRSAADQRDPRRGKKARRVQSPFLRGHTKEGDFVALDLESGRPVMGSRIVDLGDGRFQIRAGSEEEAERLMKKMRDRAASEGKEAKLERMERGEFRPSIEGQIVMRSDVWRREGAKLALAIASDVYSPEWRLSADAQRLRDWMHDRDERTEDGSAPPLVPIEPPDSRLIRDDEHLVFFTRSGDRDTYLVVILFGAAYFALPVNTTGQPKPSQAWRLDWRNPYADGATTWDTLIAEAATRLTQDADAADSDS